MQILSPNFILTPDVLLENMSVAFDKTIHKIAPIDALTQEFPHAKITTLKKNSLLMPGLINAHVHIEFSANKTELSYGDFILWLNSVIENRETLINGCASSCMQKAVEDMLACGITTFGAISSHGMDLEACVNAPQNVLFFNELIGSQATMADALFADFLSRVDASKKVKREGFIPAVAIHSPYSVHPVLIKKALEMVKNEKLKLTAHFMESEAERRWLDASDGEFKDFFEKFLKQSYAVSDSKEFLEHFNGLRTLLTHVLKADEAELETISKNKHTVIHCPVSNRLLGGGAIDLNRLDSHNIQWIVATDGLSSNYTLDLFEEMKIALFMQSDAPLLPLAKKLIKSVTIEAAKALGINTGVIAEGKNADMIVLDLESIPNDELALHLILHRYNISKIYINGTLIKEQ